MATTTTSTETSSKQMKHEDLVQFQNIFASEFNSDSFHDRVLVFEIIDIEEPEPEGETKLSKHSGGDLPVSKEEHEQQTLLCNGNNVPASNGEVEGTSHAGTSREDESKIESDAEMVALEEINSIAHKDELIVMDPHPIYNQKKEKQESGKEEKEIAGKEVISNTERDIHSNLKNAGKNKDKGQNIATKLFVHSSWLAVHSSYFKAMFSSGMRETYSKEVVMKIYQSEHQAHLVLIEAIYKLDVLNDKESSLVVDVLALADKYDVNLVFKKCKYVLISTSVTTEECEYILKIVSDIQDCTDVLDAMETFLAKEFSPLDKTWLSPKFCTLSKSSLKILLSSDKLIVESENTVFIALMKWIDCNHIGTVDDGRCSLSMVRFELMTVDFMYDIARHHTTAKKLDGFNEFLQNGLAYRAFSTSRLQQLEIKPVKRSTYCRTSTDPTFSWVIGQEEQRGLIECGFVWSSPFWLKGYMMDFRLTYQETTPGQSYELHLFVENMKEEPATSHLEISWTAKTDLFVEKKCSCLKNTYTSSSEGFGEEDIKSNIAPSLEPNTLSQMIDVWVDIK